MTTFYLVLFNYRSYISLTDCLLSEKNDILGKNLTFKATCVSLLGENF